MKCDNCRQDATRLRCEHSQWLCRSCVGWREDHSAAKRNQAVRLSTGLLTTRMEIEEVKRLRILPYEGSQPGDWIAGRMGENGRLQERDLKS